MVSFGQLLIMPDWLSYALAACPGIAILTLVAKSFSNGFAHRWGA
jgi:hypothetical protein